MSQANLILNVVQLDCSGAFILTAAELLLIARGVLEFAKRGPFYGYACYDGECCRQCKILGY